ncbi:MAG TPA: hypothetical protein VG860_22960 [Terriglobia bacterium]|jgi:hypothetical protein|nr:hypothetical protein [Terriglobia bacterium]
MDWKEQLGSLWNHLTWTGTASFMLPGALFEVQPDFVMGARLAGKNGDGHAQFGKLAVAPLGPGALVASPAGPVLLDEEAVVRALQEVVAAVGNGQPRAGLLVPDGAVRVGVFPFDELPSSRREAATLVGWRLRENLPYPPAEARLSYQTARLPAGMEVAAAAARSSVLAEFEGLLDAINRSADLILPATMALLPLLPEQGETGHLLVHVYSAAATFAVAQKERLRFWRTRDLAGLDLEDMFEQVAAEAARVVASTEDRLDVHLGPVRLCVRPPATDLWAEKLAAALGREVALLEPAPEVGGLLAGPERTAFRNYGATLAGLAANH